MLKSSQRLFYKLLTAFCFLTLIKSLCINTCTRLCLTADDVLRIENLTVEGEVDGGLDLTCVKLVSG